MARNRDCWDVDTVTRPVTTGGRTADGHTFVGYLCRVVMALAVLGIPQFDQVDAHAQSNRRPERRPADGDDSGSEEPEEPAPPCIGDWRVTLTTSAPTILIGQSLRLTWRTTTRSCGQLFLSSGDLDRSISGDGQILVFPRYSQSHLLIVRYKSRSYTLASPFVTANYPPLVRIDSTTPDPGRVLVGALSGGSSKIEICNVDIDLGNVTNIPIFAGTSLVAAQGCERGPSRLGSRVFVRNRRSDALPLFEVKGSNVLISGFRLQGPSRADRILPPLGWGAVKLAIPNTSTEVGVKVFVESVTGRPVENIQITNMEISDWSGAGISVVDSAVSKDGLLTAENPKAVRIDHNYIHGNLHLAGWGYGVVVANGGYALIEKNVFDNNRHSVAGGSRQNEDFSGYTLRENLILPDGGWHCGNICWHTHAVDMHGDGSHWTTGGHSCGTAGGTMLIEENTILYTAGRAIKIRGNPHTKVVVSNNVFSHEDSGEAIAQNGECATFGDNITNPIQEIANDFDADVMRREAECDFGGDRVKDHMIATGRTWWIRSDATGQWYFLNRMTEGLDALEVRDFDGDGKCDVAASTRSKYSKSGSGPWVSLNQ